MLTEAMGVTPPTLYAAFGSKEALYRDALARYFARPGYSGPRVKRDRGTAYQAVERYLHLAAVQFTHPDRPKGCMVATGTLHCVAENQGAAEAAAAMRARSLDSFIDQLEQAKRDGDLNPDADSGALARFYAAVLQGMSVQAIDGADTASLHAVADAALAAWPDGRR